MRRHAARARACARARDAGRCWRERTAGVHCPAPAPGESPGPARCGGGSSDRHARGASGETGFTRVSAPAPARRYRRYGRGSAWCGAPCAHPAFALPPVVVLTERREAQRGPCTRALVHVAHYSCSARSRLRPRSSRCRAGAASDRVVEEGAHHADDRLRPCTGPRPRSAVAPGSTMASRVFQSRWSMAGEAHQRVVDPRSASSMSNVIFVPWGQVPRPGTGRAGRGRLYVHTVSGP